jgi:copper(I)-binding protein
MIKILLAAAILATTILPALAHEEKSETLSISHPWSRATAPNQKVGAVFMEIKTRNGEADRLVGGSSPDAEKVEIHNHIMDSGVMRMRRIDGVDIPAEGSVELAPGGFHVMLLGLKAPLLEETVIPLTLIFEKAGAVEIEAVVEAAGARGASGTSMKHDGMKMDMKDGGMKHGSGHGMSK